MTIAVDFDGTIVEHRYPRIGKEIPFATDTLKLLQQDQHKLILWSVREGELLEEAVAWCKERGVEFYAVNRDYPEEKQQDCGFSRKLKVDLFIDDRNLGGLPDWGLKNIKRSGISIRKVIFLRNRTKRRSGGFRKYRPDFT